MTQLEPNPVQPCKGAATGIEPDMLPKLEWGDRAACRGPLIVLCHWLGGSAQSWSLLAERLSERGLRCLAVDLPGFGTAADVPGYTVRSMADAVIASIRDERESGEPHAPWLLAGHSMGGKLAAVIARDAANCAAGLGGLRSVVLLAPSPPGPEPMKESDRVSKLETIGQSTGDEATDRRHAQTFVSANAGSPALGEATLRAATDGVLQANKAAIRAWFESGSNEDWSAYVGELPLPALIFAGSEDAALGPDAQGRHTLPHFTGGGRGGLNGGELVVLEAAGHLLPLERPGVIAERIVEFCAELSLPVSRRVRVGERFAALMSSDLTSPQTRELMHDRLLEDDATYSPQAVDRAGLRVLRELARRIVPGCPFDLAARIDRRLTHGSGDGWRRAELPQDGTAWRRGLASFDAAARRAHGVGFVELGDELQDALLDQAAVGQLGEGWGERLLHAVGLSEGYDAQQDADKVYTAAEMQTWFTEVRGELAKLYMADPRTMERVGFTGFADESGFTQIRLNEREAWER